MRELPTYKDLPLAGDLPARSAWGVFGDDDEIGTINLLSPEGVRNAAALVKRGAVFSLNWDLEKPDPPLFGREALKHTINWYPHGTDDYYDRFYPQASSQWDSLSHIGHPELGYYNGRKPDPSGDGFGGKNGIQHLAARGIVGRFVLADVAGYRETIGRPIDGSVSEAITVDDIEATLRAQDVDVNTGDILLLRFGWIEWYEASDQKTRDGLAATTFSPYPGLAPEERTAEWLWDKHVAAVAADCPGLEVGPSDPDQLDRFLHYRLLPFLGLTLGELFALDALARDCREDGVYDGLLTAAPLNKVGGAGSTANALAIK